MDTLASWFWLIPLLPLAAAAIIAVLPRRARRPAMGLAIGAMALALVLSAGAFAATLGGVEAAAGTTGGAFRRVLNFDWFRMGTEGCDWGWCWIRWRR
jgi:NADH:ubiquinone oxidoreductase subunit 5 (subunit L)/multisubunit Na+/H+ antiporter MnhA subunit